MKQIIQFHFIDDHQVPNIKIAFQELVPKCFKFGFPLAKMRKNRAEFLITSTFRHKKPQ